MTTYLKTNWANFYFREKCVHHTGRPSHESVPSSSSQFKKHCSRMLYLSPISALGRFL